MRTHLLRAAALALAAACLPPAFPQAVQLVRVGKDKAYYQNSPGVANPAPGTQPCNFGCLMRFAAYVYADSSIAAPVLAGPVNTAAIGSGWNGGKLAHVGGVEWRLGNGNWDYSPSQAQLDAVFPSGTYTMTVNGTAVTLNLAGDAYPNPPVLTLSGGTWSDGAYVIHPAQRLTVTTNVYTGYGAHRDDWTQVYVGGDGINLAGVREYHSSSPGSNQVSVTVPPNTLIDRRQYYATGVFGAQVDISNALPGAESAAEYRAITNLIIRADASASAPRQVFPMTVTSSISAATASALAQIHYRPQDVGTTGSVYVFAVAPSTVVKNASVGKSAQPSWKALGAPKGTPVQCVLAQLSATGELRAVSAASLQAYVSGALSAQGQSVTILDSVPTPNVSGAAFFVGYGTSATSMISSGINQRAVSIPGAITCDPRPPQTGWWWNPEEGGRGFSIEASEGKLFMAAYLYDDSGRATWLVSSGSTSLDGSLFTGDLLGCRGGQTLGGAYPGFPQCAPSGQVTLAFNDAQHGTMVWPGGTVPIERMNLVPGGLTGEAQAGQPESGWWWNSAESGRGFFIEWQKGYANLAGYMYDEAGNPVWLITVNATPNPRSVVGNWWQYANGQTLMGAYRPATRISDNVAPVTVTFTGPDRGTMTLPGGKQIAITRQLF
jgi:hypothetical protein